MSVVNGLPEWAATVQGQYQDGVANAFVLHENVADYVLPGVRMDGFVSNWLKNRAVVVFYNRSSGIRFAVPSMEMKFREWTGLLGDDGAEAEADPVLAAIRASQGRTANDLPSLPVQPADALGVLETLMRNGDKGQVAVVIEFAESIVPAGSVSMMGPEDRTNVVTVVRWGRDPEIEAKGQMIFLLTDNIDQVSESVRSGSSKFSVVEVPFPALEERENFIRWYLDGEEAGISMDMTVEQLANLTAGLRMVNIEDIFLRAAGANCLTQGMVTERKEAIIRAEYGDVLEVMSPAGGFELIGGLEYIKGYFRSVVQDIRDGFEEFVPMGVMMLGPAGTGKTIMAEAVAFEAGFQAVKLNLGGQIASMWQGEGERKLAKALRGILTFAPCMVFVDEVDQATGRNQGGGNQQDSRIFQMLLEFTSDTSHRGQVIFLYASNRPDLMDAAFKRAGRVDEVLAFLVPNASERESIFQVMARKYGLAVENIPAEAVATTEGYTGAEIEGITRKAAVLAHRNGVTGAEGLVMAAGRIKASTRDIEFMTKIALAEIRDLDLLPPGYREMAENADELQADIEKLGPPERRGRREF